MNIELITHNDEDGYGCEVIARYIYEYKLGYKDSVKIHNCNYTQGSEYHVDEVTKKVIQSLRNSEKNNTTLLITDICPNTDLLKEIDELKQNNSLVALLVDHHKSAIDNGANKYDWAKVIIMNKNGKKESGTSLLLHTLLCNVQRIKSCNIDNMEFNKLCTFVDLVRQYDTYEFKETGNKEPQQLNDLFNLIGCKDWVSSMLSILKGNNTTFKISETDAFLVECNRAKIDRTVKHKAKYMKIFERDGYKWGYVVCDDYHSEIGNYMCVNNPEVDIALMVSIDTMTASIRTVKDIDLSVIARGFGGGGHAKAAGYPLRNDTAFINGVLIPFIDGVK